VSLAERFRLPLSFLEVSFYFIAPAKIESNRSIDIGQHQSRKLLHNLFCSRTLLKCRDNGVQCHSRSADANDAVAVHFQWDRICTDNERHHAGILEKRTV